VTGYGNDLISPIDMYLRVILECEEEHVPPMNARIAERLGRSLPTIHKAIDRMTRQRLIVVEPDRRLSLTRTGRQRAIAVLRKHRLAEVLLVRRLGVPYEQAHTEANRLQDVMGERAEGYIFRALGHPTHSPYGNPIPGLDKIGGPATTGRAPRGEDNLVSSGFTGEVVVTRIREWTQSDTGLMRKLHEAGVVAGRTVSVAQDPRHVTVGGVELSPTLARGIYVMPARPAEARRDRARPPRSTPAT
jgi:DtxR family Mn-dependent transcriptional regulator